jgi:transposase
MEHTTIAVDLAKSVFQVAVSHRPGHLDEERRLSRDRLLPFFAQRPPATIVFEACGSAHHWARQLQPFGHTVRLLPAHDVRPYVRRNKTDRTDAKGLLEANRNEEIHAVPVKTIEHQGIASLHRLRSTWLATRTARLHTIRGLLREFGVFIPVGAHPSCRASGRCWSSRRPCRCCCTRPSRQPVTRLRCSRRTCVPSSDNSGRSHPRWPT